MVTTGGASVGEEDHSATAMATAGGAVRDAEDRAKPGKPAVVGQLGSCAYLGLPGNPVSALVSWLFLGGGGGRRAGAARLSGGALAVRCR